jgi:hypothetical protein
MAVYRVYISGTPEDLRAHLAMVRDAVIRMGMLPLMNEDFGMIDADGVDAIEARIHQADIFIGVYAYRYGSLIEGEVISVIEKEYNVACRANKRRLLFLIDPAAHWPVSQIERGEGMERLEALMRRIRSETVYNHFTTPDSLQARVFFGLHQLGASVHRLEGYLEVKPLFGLPVAETQFKADVFMIMPFAQRFQHIYFDAIVPMIQRMGWSVKRGDDYFSEHAIINEIWAAIYFSKVVIAECTDRNPNVYYELGIAHAVGKPSILITQDINDIPFDLRHLRIIEYQDTPDGLEDLQRRLAKACEGLMIEAHSRA